MLMLALREPVSAYRQIADLWPRIKAELIAGHRLQLIVKRETRSAAQNRLLHSSLGDVSRQIEWAQRKRDIEVWKRLHMAAWMRATHQPIELLPALDGAGVDIVFRRSSELNRAEC